MGDIFSKKKSRVTEQDKAILQLKQQRDKLKQYQKRIDLQLQGDKELAKKLVANGRKDRALLLLRKKRFLEQQLIKSDGMLENVERLTQDLEYAQVELQVIDVLKSGNVALKTLNEMLSISEIEKIMDETKEGIEKQQEIDELLSGKLTDEDEQAVLDELNELAGELPELPEVPEDQPEKQLNLPDVPKTEILANAGKKVKNREKIALAAT